MAAMKVYRRVEQLALAMFLGLAAAHVAALVGLAAPSVWLAAPVIPLVLFAHMVTIIGMLGGSLMPPRERLTSRQRRKAMRIGLRYVPPGWRVFGLAFWNAYMPVTFIWRLLQAGGDVEEANGHFVLTSHGRVLRTLTAHQAFRARADMFVAFTVVLMGFALSQYLLLRFIIPNRDKILEEAMRSSAL